MPNKHLVCSPAVEIYNTQISPSTLPTKRSSDLPSVTESRQRDKPHAQALIIPQFMACRPRHWC